MDQLVDAALTQIRQSHEDASEIRVVLSPCLVFDVDARCTPPAVRAPRYSRAASSARLTRRRAAALRRSILKRADRAEPSWLESSDSGFQSFLHEREHGVKVDEDLPSGAALGE
jgi:hypothetical protein